MKRKKIAQHNITIVNLGAHQTCTYLKYSTMAVNEISQSSSNTEILYSQVQSSKQQSNKCPFLPLIKLPTNLIHMWYGTMFLLFPQNE